MKKGFLTIHEGSRREKNNTKEKKKHKKSRGKTQGKEKAIKKYEREKMKIIINEKYGTWPC